MDDLKYVRSIFGKDCEVSLREDRTLPWIVAAYASPKFKISVAGIFPTVEGLQTIRQLGFEPPAKCCVCGDKPSCSKPMRSGRMLTNLAARIGIREAIEVPHCSRHGNQQHALFGLILDRISKQNASIICFGTSTSFLVDIHNFYTQGEQQPPWIFNPYQLPWHGWNQGLEESWLHAAWLPFWARLSNADRVRYLDKWKASPDWREALLEGEGPFQLSDSSNV
jgi:hypothetical protein